MKIFTKPNHVYLSPSQDISMPNPSKLLSSIFVHLGRKNNITPAAIMVSLCNRHQAWKGVQFPQMPASILGGAITTNGDFSGMRGLGQMTYWGVKICLQLTVSSNFTKLKKYKNGTSK